MKQNQIEKISIVSSFNSLKALGLGALLLTLNVFGAYFFLDAFSGDSAKEASLFNGSTNSQNEVLEANASTADLSTVSVIPLGSTFGIKLYTDGVIVTALSDINTRDGVFCPAKDAGIEPGDYIKAVNGENVTNNSHFSSLMAKAAQGDILLTILRGGETFDTQLVPLLDGNVMRCGMWIRDSAAGIGTLTFAEEGTNKFAGLGHGICDIDTGKLMSLRGGEPSEITICDIDKGEKKKPGKINGFFSENGKLGLLYNNNETGIYGKLDNIPKETAVPLASKNEVHTGEAEILVTIDNSGPKRFTAEIESIASDRDKAVKNLVIKITDPELLKVTGGIVQGMSGTPVLQDGKLVAAITHVFLDDPTKGYGIFAETMYSNFQNIS